MTTATWRAMGLQQEVLTIPQGDPDYLKCGIPCNFYVAVYGFGQASSFQLMASLGRNDTVQALTSGEPQLGEVGRFDVAYFILQVSCPCCIPCAAMSK